MEKFEGQNRAIRKEGSPQIERVYRALGKQKDESFLNEFTEEQQKEIKHKQQILSSLAYFIGKDFRIPVELNAMGEGWHWDFENNVIRIDPKDLLEKPMDYLRFVICHEGGHRRISRTEFISKEEWNQPGFAFMMNAIEDPRDNNFVAESYPKFREQMALAYNEDLDFEAKAKQKAGQELGYQPRFMKAGFEYIKQWFRETQGKDFELTADLPDEVKDIVSTTLASAQDSWCRYPSRQEADNGGTIGRKKVDGETLIKEYAKTSYEINRDEVWPDFKKLVEADIEDQKVQEALKDMQQGEQNGTEGGESGGPKIPQNLKDRLKPEEQQALSEAIQKAIQERKEGEEKSEEQGKPSGKSVNMDALSQELKQKIKDYIESLPEDQQRKIAEKAEAAFKEFEDSLNNELAGKMLDNPETRSDKTESASSEPESEEKEEIQAEVPKVDSEELKKYKEHIEKAIKKDANIYETMRREVLPLIDKLENDLREIFVARKNQGWKSGFTTGKKIDIKRRIQEKAQSVPVMESKAWQKRELPQEKDYAISLLVDLSGSMRDDQKIQETFKAVVVLSEVLNRLSIDLEILGFNDRIYEYQNFGDPMSKAIREHMGGMLSEVSDNSGTGKAMWNDDGWALEQASNRLTGQKADQKFLLVLSDGTPVESPMHPRNEYELGSMIKKVLSDTDVRLIGLGIGRGTGHVESYYPNSIANVKVGEMAEKLADLIKEVVANYDKF